MKRAVFLDRDGTIIVEKNYLSDPEQVVVFPGAAEACTGCQDRGFELSLSPSVRDRPRLLHPGGHEGRQRTPPRDPGSRPRPYS